MNPKDVLRRNFLKGLAVAIPTLEMLGVSAAEAAEQTSEDGLFTPVHLDALFNCSATDFGPREPIASAGSGGLIRTAPGSQNFRGVPFTLGAEGVQRKSWVALSTRESSWTAQSIEIPIGQKLNYLCLAQFCDWDENELHPTGVEDIEKVGQLLAEAVLVFEDGSERVLPIRRRFEVSALSVPWGHWCFLAMKQSQNVPRKLSEGTGLQWGKNQTGLWSPPQLPGSLTGDLWVCALENPEPGHSVKMLRLRSTSPDLLVLCGLTLFHGSGNPLRHGRLNVYRITLPDGRAAAAGEWRVSVDLGVVARTYSLEEFHPDVWLEASDGRPMPPGRSESPLHLYAEVTAHPNATLRLEDTVAGRQYVFDLGKAVPGSSVEARPAGLRVELLEPRRTWLHGRVLDGSTKHPTPVRLAFLSCEGRYIPPYGHRTEINGGWFQDYGADLKLGDRSFAYVDGTFQVELPFGEVYVEINKGFEYETVRRKLTIAPGQRELELEIPRYINLRSRGWVTADTHVHFLSPSTAVLEAQAEGLNLINLLAAQWGDLYTNVGDLPHGPLTSRDGETVVWPGTENRMNVLGHIGLLGGHGEPVYPLSSSHPTGLDESYFGDPLRTLMADWADACHQRGGLTVGVHFPYPTAELAADIVLGKIDAVEVRPRGERSNANFPGFPQATGGTRFNNLYFLDWYRYLNCGYRLPLVGGTDKMSASIAAGASRTYAWLGKEEFSFSNWAKAVRAGNTFMSTGPLLLFQADGRSPGAEITLRANGGTIEVLAEANSVTPVHRVEIVFNGRVVSSTEESGGTRHLILKDKVRVDGPGWLAARCASGYGPAAHTSPVYVNLPGRGLFSAPAAAYMHTLIEGARSWVDNLETIPDGHSLEHVRAVLDQAHQRLHERMALNVAQTHLH